ncbi:MAG: DUF5685 family protein [Oscillospiraceae bacterium]|nr:DUF5685 family protein [Oscillospiraceae bacterium]
MFGYLRPLQGELKVSELERFRACYCGLCRAIGAKYGAVARFTLSYELVFLAMLLWDVKRPVTAGREQEPIYERAYIKKARCAASPLRKKRYYTRNGALDDCAGYNVILSWWKLRDSICDERFFKSLPQRFMAALLRRAYRKAARELPGFDSAARTAIAELSELERSGGASMDEAADKFAAILQAAAPDGAPEEELRPISQMLYHVGRWIYLMDACDDYEKDVQAGAYNPVAANCPPEQGKMTDEGKERLNTTLAHSNNLVCSAFELLPVSIWTDTVRNTICLGMPDVRSRVVGELCIKHYSNLQKH